MRASMEAFDRARAGRRLDLRHGACGEYRQTGVGRIGAEHPRGTRLATLWLAASGNGNAGVKWCRELAGKLRYLACLPGSNGGRGFISFDGEARVSHEEIAVARR